MLNTRTAEHENAPSTGTAVTRGAAPAARIRGLVLAIGLPVAVAAVVFAWATSLYPHLPLIRDAYGYSMSAQRLLDDGYFAYSLEPPGSDVEPNAAVTPGYVVFLAGVYALAPGADADAVAEGYATMPYVRAVQFALALAIVALVAGAGYVLGGTWLGLVAGLLAAGYLPFGWSSSPGLSENLATALAALQLYLAVLVVAERTPVRPRTFAALGVVSGALALVRPAFSLWFLVPVAIVLVRRARRGRDLARAAGAFALGMALVMGPWVIRNAVVLGEFVPLSTGSGHPQMVSAGGIVLTPAEEAIRRAAELEGADPWRAIARDRIGRQLKADPVGYWRTRVEHAVDVVDGPWVAPHNVYQEVSFGAVEYPPEAAPFDRLPPMPLQYAMRYMNRYHEFVLLAAAVALLFVRRMPRALLALSVPLYAVAVHLPTLFLDRYFFPATPGLVLAAAVTVFGVVRMIVRAPRMLRARVAGTAGAPEGGAS
jgi:hypothetical protein